MVPFQFAPNHISEFMDFGPDRRDSSAAPDDGAQANTGLEYRSNPFAAREAMATPADRELAMEFTARPELTQKLIGKIARKKKAISKKETMKERSAVVRKLGVRIGVASGGE